MKENKKIDKWIGILSISVIAIVAVVFVSLVSGTHLAKGTYSVDDVNPGGGSTNDSSDNSNYCSTYGLYSSIEACQTSTKHKCQQSAVSTCFTDTGTSCLSNYYINGSECKKCPDGQISDGTTTTCHTCDTGYTPNASTGKCDPNPTKCDVGYYINGSECKKCPDGQISDGTTNTCHTCGTGYTANASTGKCVPNSSNNGSNSSDDSSNGSSTTSYACYLVDHKYVWASSQPSGGTLVSSKTTASSCSGCESGYAADSNNNCVKPTSSSQPSNPQTGSTAIIFAWVIGLIAIGYSFWYFKRTSTN